MSRSWDQFHYTRGGDCGGEYTSHRAGMRYPVAGRFTKTLTHRIERQQARRELERAQRLRNWIEDVPVWQLTEVNPYWDSASQEWREARQVVMTAPTRDTLEQVVYWVTLYDYRETGLNADYEIELV